MKKTIALLLSALLLLPVLCGCGTGTAAEKKELSVVRLNEVTHSVFYAPQYVALEQGFFSGVEFVASVHAATLEDALQRPQVRVLQQQGALRFLFLLEGRCAPGRIREIRQLPLL